MQIKNEQIEAYTKFFHGLSNPTRYQIIISLLHGKKNVGELAEDLGYSQSLISMQLKCLKWCNFVNSIKDGKNIYYYISDERIRELIQLGQSIAEGSINNICTCEVIGNEKNELREENIDNGKRNFE
ncbi:MULTISPECIES: ArsR/SmtB family transcription factor [Thermotaleaceae]|uniref:DNA-binding transcriptional regulator, ArsR family n=1 Tax=Geosporobacter subterraneus DSM 17957 TaxID=1121919 RepID=A0A1M6HRJ1_9FIRM|nr:metalloregulator ArsR/SmtB family transcription factor [Geosporobacter subterraneus]SHJ24724.1 DNA-binding transcriptional regulator, ArsR family [Geosporobacter subterraneus DSM 17957]